MNSLWQKTRWMAGVGWRLLLKELRQNIMVYLSPLLFFLPIAILSIINGRLIPLGGKASIAALVIAFVFAVIYGLQSFAGETDRKTIDFLLSRPISPTLLIVVKFFINLGIYLFWLFIITRRVVFDWSLFKLPKGVDGNGIALIFPIIMSMGFFAGLIARGAERLVVTVGLAGLMAGGCYLLWNQAFLLMAADFYWFDIPPHIVALVSRWLPGILLVVSLSTPLVFSLWFLRGRSAFYKFKPFQRLFSAWAIITLVIWAAVIFLGPAIWPLKDRLPYGGDWHPKSGIVISGTYFKPHMPVSSLYLARVGGKAHPVYHGGRIHSARWSPDGKSIAFVDGPWIKVWQRSGVQSIVRGSFPFWSRDGRRLAFLQKPDNRQRFSNAYLINLKTRSIIKLYAFPKEQILGLAWDSNRRKLYLLHEDQNMDLLEVINLRTKKAKKINCKSDITLYLQNPTLSLGSDGTLLLGVAYEHKSMVSALYPGAEKFDVLEDSKEQGIDLLSQTILSPTEYGYLVPRMDGAFEYKGFIPPDEDEENH